MDALTPKSLRASDGNVAAESESAEPCREPLTGLHRKNNFLRGRAALCQAVAGMRVKANPHRRGFPCCMTKARVVPVPIITGLLYRGQRLLTSIFGRIFSWEPRHRAVAEALR